MDFFFRNASRSLAVCARKLLICAIAGATAITSQPATAQMDVSLQSTPHVVRNDRGGLLRQRLFEIGRLRQSGTPVEIRGNICYSTCTLYLGLPNTCISPGTTFGFHGPSSYGAALDPKTFNRASEIIASYYPPALKRWYLETGRYKIRTITRIKGARIIEMGIRAC